MSQTEADVGQVTRLAPSYLAGSLVVTALLFLPTGLIAVFFSYRTRYWGKRGNAEKARRASRWALAFMLVSAALGIFLYASLAGIFLLLGAFS